MNILNDYEQRSLSDRIGKMIRDMWHEFRAPLLTSFIIAVAAYMFIFTNKIPNWDDMQFLFGKGYTLTSGRWGLDLLSFILPDYSMPWLWGTLSVVLISIASCLIMRIFQIQNKLLQCALAGVVIAFPSEIGTMLYMFTSSSYAIALLCSVLGVYLFKKRRKRYQLISLFLTVFSCSIYQAYIAITASFFVLLLIQDILHNERPVGDIVKTGCSHLLLLAVSLLVYYGITLLLLHLSGNTLNAWAERATTDSDGILYRALRAWKLFLATILLRTYGLATTTPSMIVHTICAVCTVLVGFYMVFRQKRPDALILFLLLVGVLLPLSINALVLLLGENGVHALTLYSFFSVYILAILVAQQLPLGKLKSLTHDIVVVSLIIITASNIYTANKSYLKQYMVYENSFSFYESIITQVQSTEGFTESSKLAIMGAVDHDSSYLAQFGTGTIYGLCGFKGEAISDEFITYYLGFDVSFASSEEKESLSQDPRYLEMESYPFYGYIQKIDEYIVVKLGD